MLARNYKTAAELGISNEVYEALFEVRDRLDRGKLVHWHPQDPDNFSQPHGAQRVQHGNVDERKRVRDRRMHRDGSNSFPALTSCSTWIRI